MGKEGTGKANAVILRKQCFLIAITFLHTIKEMSCANIKDGFVLRNSNNRYHRILDAAARRK